MKFQFVTVDWTKKDPESPAKYVSIINNQMVKYGKDQPFMKLFINIYFDQFSEEFRGE